MSTSASVLFIGGPWDGRRCTAVIYSCLMVPDVRTPQPVVYRLEHFNQHPVYVIDGMSAEDACMRLLEKYKP